jgi:ASC-1-like (ASCH) protein
MSDPLGTKPRRELTIRKPYLQLIADGVKTVEVRVGYPSMRRIQPEQDLIFVAGNQRIMTRVRRVTEYPTFDQMLDHEDPRAIGGELGESRERLLSVIRDIYPPEKEQLGVLAIEVELV